MKPANWQLNGAVARLQLPKFAGSVDVLQPGLGLRELSTQGQPLAAQLLRVDVPAITVQNPHEAADWYERCGDLVATYAQTDSRPFRTQVYWRTESFQAAEALAAIELVASVQTSLLDSHPQLTISSLLPSTEVLRLNDPQTGSFVVVSCSSKAPFQAGPSQCACYVLRLSGGWSYAEMVHPLDARESTVRPVVDREHGRELVEICHRLFTSELEKGVILRSRVLGLLLPRENDLALAARLYSQFSATEPPLTT